MTRRSTVAMVIGVASLGAAVLGWYAMNNHRAVSAGLPEPPDTSSWPGEFQERLTRTQRRAHGFIHPIAGLGELGRLYHANGFFDEAVQCYELIEGLEPGNPRWPHLQACILAANGRLEEAAPKFQRAIVLAPNYLPARLRLGDVLLKANQTGRAAEVYRDVLQQHSAEPYALLGLARCAIAADDWSKARDELVRCLSANPEFVGAMSLLATVQDHLGDTRAGDVLREQLNKREFVDLMDPWENELMEDCYDPYRLSVAAAVAIFRSDAVSAERWLQRAIGLSARPAPYYRQLGKLKMGLKEWAAARANFEQATVLAPDDADAWALLVNVLTTAGDRAAAYQAVNAGLKHCPESRALHYALGHMLNEDGQYPQAIGQLQEAKRLQPSEANAYVELAIIHFKLGEIEAGIDEMRQALVVQPDQPVALVVLGRDAIENGNETAARGWIRRARLQRRVRAEDLQQLVNEYQTKFRRVP